jgi:lipoprotein-anchoring transpeptidase ErfK/SrfK
MVMPFLKKIAPALLLALCVTAPAQDAITTVAPAGPAGGQPVPQMAAPAATPEAAPVAGDSQVAKAEPVAEREVVTRLQIFLDQLNFGPGKIDGRWGEFTGKALAKYAKANDLAVDATIYEKLRLADLHPIYTTYTIQAGDTKWVGPVSGKPSQQAKFKKLLYGDLLEFVSERYHSDPEFLRKLNPAVKLDSLKPGDTILVPNVAPFKIEELPETGNLPENPALKTRTVTVNRRERMATVFEGEKIIAAYPITPGSGRLPTPPGKWRILGVAAMPTFRWDEGVLNHGKRTDQYHMLQPGPNNPVGVAWIGLSKPGIGMHGTNNPDTIGRAASHGCMRLANWDAIRLAHMITAGVTVTIQ